MRRDKFHDYLDYCERVRPVSVGDYIEQLRYGSRLSVREFNALIVDVLDTYHAGLLVKIPLDNGGVAYVRKTSSHSEKVSK